MTEPCKLFFSIPVNYSINKVNSTNANLINVLYLQNIKTKTLIGTEQLYFFDENL